MPNQAMDALRDEMAQHAGKDRHFGDVAQRLSQPPEKRMIPVQVRAFPPIAGG